MTVASLSVQEAIKNNFKVDFFFFLKKGGYRKKKEKMKHLHKVIMAQNESQKTQIASRNTVSNKEVFFFFFTICLIIMSLLQNRSKVKPNKLLTSLFSSFASGSLVLDCFVSAVNCQLGESCYTNHNREKMTPVPNKSTQQGQNKQHG